MWRVNNLRSLLLRNDKSALKHSFKPFQSNILMGFGHTLYAVLRASQVSEDLQSDIYSEKRNVYVLTAVRIPKKVKQWLFSLQSP